jgi:hypothetical protein
LEVAESLIVDMRNHQADFVDMPRQQDAWLAAINGCVRAPEHITPDSISKALGLMAPHTRCRYLVTRGARGPQQPHQTVTCAVTHGFAFL